LGRDYGPQATRLRAVSFLAAGARERGEINVNNKLTASIAALACVMSTPAAAQGIDANQARYIAANCANCHGTTGKSSGAMPSLSGQSKVYLLEQMRAFRDGKRTATIMHQIAKGYTDAQIDAVAEHFSRQPK
jgi:sulfide dehydrogenase cytochrome subunit